MSDINPLIKKLCSFADSAENCFDVYLGEHRQKLCELEEYQLEYLVLLREKCAKVSSITTFTRDELDSLINSGLFENDGIFSEISNGFNIADSFFGVI